MSSPEGARPGGRVGSSAGAELLSPTAEGASSEHPRAEGSSPLLVDDASIEAAVAAEGPLGLDTEFMRTDTFFPVPALYQIASASGTVLVDGQADASFAALAQVMTDPTRLKIMHSLSEDLEVLDCHLGVLPQHVIDTQLAHAFVTPEYGVGYAALVERHLGIALAKHSTRSNWLRRPLSPEQLSYAREDVEYLLPLWERIGSELESLGRLDWAMEEMARLLVRRPPPEEHYRGVSGARRLSRRQLAILRSLITWREREARRRDMPRAHLARDDALLGLALDEGPSPSLEALPKGLRRRYGKTLLQTHARGRDDPCPPQRLPEPLSRRQGELAAALRSSAKACSERLGMAPELLARRRDMESCVLHWREHGNLPPWFGAWRESLLGDEFRRRLGGLPT